MRAADILFEVGSFWVCRGPKHPKGSRGFEVYQNSGAASVRVAVIGFDGHVGLARAIAEARRRHEAQRP
jgi:hypothetical protein